MIYTACPECGKVTPITIAQLRETRAISFCEQCGIKYDALEQLSDSLADEAIEGLDEHLEKQNDLLGFKYKPEIEEHQGPMPWEEQTHPSRSKAWGYASLLGTLVLVLQIFIFEFNNFSQNTRGRPWLISFCKAFMCTVPPYINTKEIKVLHGSLQSDSDNTLNLETAFTNRAPFPQPYPKIKLTLLNLQGMEWAHRTFDATVYLSPDSEQLMQVDQTVQLNLAIVKPEQAIGGYTIELL